tara:strand:+ start:989 stop:1483 length:495 start_codon:yes stop_codon:yes gene_type:complete
MAVPGSGTLTLLGLAQECYYGTYGSGTITAPIVLSDLTNGGNSGGSGMVYPPINQQSPSHPNPGFVPILFSSFYNYDKNYNPTTYYPITLTFDLNAPDDPSAACASPFSLDLWIDAPDYQSATKLYANDQGDFMQPGMYAEIDGKPRLVRGWDGMNFNFDGACK